MLADAPSTEAELRALASDARGWARVLQGRLEARERHLRELVEDPESSIAALADALRSVVSLRHQVSETLWLLAQLDDRSRELRVRWVRL